ncbi:uncharacterized protein LOC125545840 [Triticum urartu]|uniref:DUF6598 domain-containing protein n=1 Tax=Triticum urartu TaxID=4572 RepID=A0A8R7PWI5_TRIUA|nr:uncharacterized protein LOC125545840 [Triticum urartu]
MHRLSSPLRSLLSLTASTPPSWWPLRRVLPHNSAARRVCRFPHGSRSMASSSGVKQMAGYPFDGVVPMAIFPKSSHHDGSIYKGRHAWKKEYRIADRNETWLEPMMLTDPSDCCILDGACMQHTPSGMFQIFSLKLAKIHVGCGPVELYGYIAMRDDLDRLLNYVVSFKRDDPIIVEQGSLINMSGPKRGIDSHGNILIEYDMRIKTAEEEKHDLQLIDGASIIVSKDLQNCHTFTSRIYGDCGAVDFTASRLENAVEATLEVVISEVQNSFNLCLSCFTSGLNEEIRLFNGTIGESCGLKRSVVAVVIASWMTLKFKLGAESSSSAEHHCSFIANNHGIFTQKMKTDFALLSVKVTWSTLPRGSHAHSSSCQP